jgi:hypothetical protein
MVAAQGGEMTDLGARTRQIGTFPVYRENISPAQNAGLPEGSGPLGVAPTCIVRLRAVGTLRYCVMRARRARSTTKSGFPKFSLFHPSSGLTAEQKKTIHWQKGFSPHLFPFLPQFFSTYNPGLTFPVKSLIKQTNEGRYYFHM